MRKGFLFFILLELLQTATAQYSIAPGSVLYLRSIVFSQKQSDAFAFLSNPAVLAGSGTSLGIFSERRYLLQELSHFKAALTVHTPSGNFGVQASQFGFQQFRDTKLAIAHGRRMGEHFEIGLQFNYHSFNSAGYGREAFAGFEAGAILHFNERLRTGIQVCNPVTVSLSNYEKPALRSSYSIGIGYEPSGIFYIGAELVKEELHDVDFHLGLQYQITPLVSTRFCWGYSEGPCFGVGLKRSAVSIHFFSTYHAQLGFSPGLMLLYILPAKTVEK